MPGPAFLPSAHRPSSGARASALAVGLALAMPMASGAPGGAAGAATPGLCGLAGAAASPLARQAAALLADRLPAQAPAEGTAPCCVKACHLPGDRKRRVAG